MQSNNLKYLVLSIEKAYNTTLDFSHRQSNLVESQNLKKANSLLIGYVIS